MQRILNGAVVLMIGLLFLGSMVVAHEEPTLFDGDDPTNGIISNSGSNPLLRARLNAALTARTITDAEKMKIKEKFMTQGKMIRAELDVSDGDISDIDAAVLASLGISAERLRQFKNSDDVKKFVMKLKENNSNLVVKLQMQKKLHDDSGTLNTEKRAIREAANKNEKLMKLAALLKKIAKNRLGDDPGIEARIQAQLDRIKANSSSVILTEIESKLKLETNLVRTAHLTKKGAQILEKAKMLQAKLDTVLPKLQTVYGAMDEGAKKEVVKNALARLDELNAKLDAQVPITQAAYDAFIASGGNTPENAMVLNKEFVALKVIAHRVAQATRIVGHIIYRLNNAPAADVAVVGAVQAEVDDSIDSVDEVEVEIEVEQEIVDETTTTGSSGDDAATVAAAAAASTLVDDSDDDASDDGEDDDDA